MKEDERVSVYISQPVPCRYSFCHCFMSVLEGTALMATRLDIMLLNPAARQDWAMKPSLNSALKNGELVELFMIGTDQADHGVPGLVPGGNVQQVGLVVVEQQLDDHPRVLTEVFDGDDSHDV